MRKIKDAEKFIRARGWVKYEIGQDVTPPSATEEWWYHSRRPDQDWYRTARDVFNEVFTTSEPVTLA